MTHSRTQSLGLTIAFCCSLGATAAAQSAEQREALGIELATGAAAGSFFGPTAGGGGGGGGSLVLMPDSTADRVIAFDPMTGDVVDPDYVPGDSTNLSTPVNAIPGPNCTILISDQLKDVLQQYDLAGNYLGIFAPAGGVDNTILDNVRGATFHPQRGTYLVTVGSGANAGAVAEFDTTGNYVGNFVAPGSGGIASPFDVTQTTSNFLVAEINNDGLLEYQNDGTFLQIFAPVNTFPEQVTVSATAVYAANFSGTAGDILIYTPAGVLVRSLDVPGQSGFRGVYELGNGNLLASNGSSVFEINPLTGAIISTKITGVSGRFFELFDGVGVPYGTGCAGTGGFVPRLAVAGCLAVGQRVAFDLSDGIGGGAAVYMFGTAPTQFPILGCELLVAPPFVEFANVTLGGAPGVGGEGSFTVGVVLPPPTSGLDLHVQVGVFDPGATQSVAFSNGLRAHVQ